MSSHRSQSITRNGQGLDDWDETIGDLERQLGQLEEAGPLAIQPLFARWERLREGLLGLQEYYARLPAETARFSDDPDFLEQVVQVAGRRIQLINDLLAALERV
ncbi:MAG: hypothetical protein HGA45_18650 [Chloroflexales bacterium]|nr:hypothetical protein [Chloroflexales bacterium]